MFLDIKDFPALKYLVDHVDDYALEFENNYKNNNLLHEFLTSKPREFIPNHIKYWTRENGIYPDQIGYEDEDVALIAFPLYKTGFPINWYDPIKAFPKLYEDILKVNGINFSAFFRLSPGLEVLEHAHNQANYIFHLCLFDIDGESKLICNGHEKILKKKGDYALFDYSLPHSSINRSKTERINLVIDFTPKLI